MMYDVSRQYTFPWNECQADLDSLVNKRINELIEYKLSINKDNKSVFYKRFYDKNEEFNSQNEIDKLNLGNHMIHSMFGVKGNSQFVLNQISRVKIVEVFDSTATAIIYKPRNPHSKVAVGDYILY